MLLVEGPDRATQQDLGLVQVGGGDEGVGQQRLPVELLGRRLEQPVAACGHHDGVDDQQGQSAGGARSATARTVAAVAGMPVFTAATVRSSSTVSTWATTNSAGTA